MICPLPYPEHGYRTSEPAPAMERVPVPMQYLCRYKGAARLVMPRAMVHLDTIRVGIRGFLRPTRCCVP